MKKSTFFIILFFLLLAVFVGFQNKEKLAEMFQEKAEPTIEPTLPEQLKNILGWKIIDSSKEKITYSSNGEKVTATIKSLSENELIKILKQEFTKDNWDADNNYFIKDNKICWATKDNKLICFDKKPIPLAILTEFRNVYLPNPDIIKKIFPEEKDIKEHCGNGIIEENLGENCEPPEYMELINNRQAYVCKTKYGNFYDIKCSKQTCRCVSPSTTENDYLNKEPPILTPILLCGNGILNPGEQCDAGIPCPAGFMCAACRCIGPGIAGKCGDGIIQAGETCEFDAAGALLIPCPKDFVCQPPGSPKECTCLTTIEPKGGEEMPVLGEEPLGEEKPPVNETVNETQTGRDNRRDRVTI